jgi:hypothetical protein
MGPWPRFYQVTTISNGRPGGATHTGRQIRLKARSQLKNGSGRAGEHPTSILAVEKADAGWGWLAKLW